MKAKEQYCWWCGESLGVYVAYRGDMDTCGASECEREARDAHAEDGEDEDGPSRMQRIARLSHG